MQVIDNKEVSSEATQDVVTPTQIEIRNDIYYTHAVQQQEPKINTL